MTSEDIRSLIGKRPTSKEATDLIFNFFQSAGLYDPDATAPPDVLGITDQLWDNLLDIKAREIFNMTVSVWERNTAAPEIVKAVANSVRPGLGRSCSCMGMAVDGTRYAFVFDNPHPNRGYWWMEMPALPVFCTFP